MKSPNALSIFTRTIVSPAIITLAIVTPKALANDRFVDTARVTQVHPVYTTIERKIPQEQCWVEQVREETPVRHQRNSATGTILGGIIGGAIGNSVGAGRDNKKVGAVVGTILGMSIGNDISRNQRHHRERERTTINYRDVERCEVRYNIETEQELVGYDVTYQYHGRTYTTQMDHKPGKQLKIAVNIQPLSR